MFSWIYCNWNIFWASYHGKKMRKYNYKNFWYKYHKDMAKEHLDRLIKMEES